MHIDNILKKIDFTTLLIFQSVCEQGSLGKAAELNTIALSAASKRLTDLEATVGTKLFIRQSSGMVMTPAGENLLFYTRIMIQNMYKATSDLEEFKLGLKGFIRLQATLSAILEFLPYDLSQFTQINPNIKIELEQQISSQIIKNIRDEKADLGICIINRQESDLTYHLYQRDQLVLVAQNQAYFEQHEIHDLDSAFDCDFIGLQAHSSINQSLKEQAMRIDKPLKLRILVSSFDALCQMTQVGMGVGIIPKKVFEVFGQPLGLAYIDIQEPWAFRELYLISKSDELLNPVTTLLKNHLLSMSIN